MLWQSLNNKGENKVGLLSLPCMEALQVDPHMVTITESDLPTVGQVQKGKDGAFHQY